MPGRPGVADERHPLAGDEPGQQLGRPLRLVVLVVAEELRRDAVTREERARPPRVLAEHEVGLGELTKDAERDVLEIADRRRADGERHCPRFERLEGDQPRADHAGLLAELGRDDANPIAPGRQRVAAHRLLRRLEQKVERVAEAAADDDHLGVEHVDEAGHAGAELSPHLGQRAGRALVAVPCCCDELPRVRLRSEQLPRELRGRTPGREVLEMPSPRAEAAALGPVELEHHVAELGRGAARSAVEPAAEDQPAADTRAEGQHDHVLRAAAGADRPLGHRSGIRVVVDRDRQPQVLLGSLSQRDALERNVNREDRRAFALVDRRRDADADGGHAVVP